MTTPKEKTACFTGHREIPADKADEIMRNTKRIIMSLYNKGYRHFVAGGALGYDTIAARAVLAARGYYGDVTLELCLPCKNQAARWSQEQRNEYEELLKLSDGYSYLRDNYTPSCMHERNRAMVDKSSYCIAYMTKRSGGTSYTVDYAANQGIPVINAATFKGEIL